MAIEARLCAACGRPLKRREGEMVWHFNARGTCGFACARVSAAKKCRARGGFRYEVPDEWAELVALPAWVRFDDAPTTPAGALPVYSPARSLTWFSPAPSSMGPCGEW